MTDTLVIIPAFNEEVALPQVIEALQREMPGFDILVVDDGSSDGTAAAARAAKVRVAVLPFNVGIGGALRTGFSYALSHGYERAIQFDGDGQHDPTSIRQIIEALDAGADMVVGSRFAASPKGYDVGPTRRRAMRFLRIGVKVLSGTEFTDVSSGFRGFSRSLLAFFAKTYPAEYMESTESLLLALHCGFRVEEVPVAMGQRVGGQPSARNFKLAYSYLRLLLVMVVSISRRPVVHPRASS